MARNAFSPAPVDVGSLDPAAQAAVADAEIGGDVGDRFSRS